MTTEQEDRRQELAETSDPRVARTRQRIVAGCRELLESDTPVTVAEICAQAGVGRSTFYTHFATVGDVAVAAVDGLFEEITLEDIERRTTSALSRSVIVRMGIEKLLQAVVEERAFFLYALAAPATERVRERFVIDLASSLQGTLRAEQSNTSQAFYRTASVFTASGAVGALLDWLAEPAGRSQAQMVEILIDLLPHWMTDEPHKG